MASSKRQHLLMKEEHHHSSTTSDDRHHDNNKMQRRNARGSIVDSVVETAKLMNSLVLDYCSICTVYIDRQVQFELDNIMGMTRMENPVGAGFSPDDGYDAEDAAARSSSSTVNNTSKMFDEDSVVESVHTRY
jgi:Zn-finger nucleic acid-binding protein